MTIYIAMDIGCIECGAESSLIGIYNDREEAQKICDELYEHHIHNWPGEEHRYEVFPGNLPGEVTHICQECICSTCACYSDEECCLRHGLECLQDNHCPDFQPEGHADD